MEFIQVARVSNELEFSLIRQFVLAFKANTPTTFLIPHQPIDCVAQIDAVGNLEPEVIFIIEMDAGDCAADDYRTIFQFEDEGSTKEIERV